MRFFKDDPKAANLAFSTAGLVAAFICLVAAFIWWSGENCREVCEEHASYAVSAHPDTCLCQQTTGESLWVPMSKGATEGTVAQCHAPTPEGCEG